MNKIRTCLICGAALRTTQKANVCDPCKERELAKNDQFGTKKTSEENDIKIKDLEPFYTVEEIAKKIGLGTRRTRDILKERGVRVLRIKGGRRLLIPRKELPRLFETPIYPEEGIHVTETSDDLADAFSRLKKAINILKVPKKDLHDIEMASQLLKEIPFSHKTAELYSLFLAHDSDQLSFNEKSEVLEGFRVIFMSNRGKEDPLSIHLSQRSIHWMARSGEEEFILPVKRLYQSEWIPLIKRGMVIGLLFSDKIEPDEFLKVFLNKDSNKALNILAYQMRSGDVAYSMENLIKKDIRISGKFTNSIQILLHELTDFERKPASICSLFTLIDILSFGKGGAFKDLRDVLSQPVNKEILIKLLSKESSNPTWRLGIEKLKELLKEERK